MLKKTFWHKLRDLFEPQYFIAARIETVREPGGDSYVTKTTLHPIFKDALVNLYNIDINDIVLITTERDISL